ncbi:unnamed protein product, partial [marine sediment metagenome]
ATGNVEMYQTTVRDQECLEIVEVSLRINKENNERIFSI